MDFDYLRSIKEGKTNQTGYIIKHLEPVEKTYDVTGTQHFRTHSSYYVSYPETVNDYRYKDFLDDLKELMDERNHIFSEDIAHILTFILIRIRDKSLSTQKAWSDFYHGMFTKCDLHLEYPIIGMTIDIEEPLQLRNYDIGNFDVYTFRDKLTELPKTNYWDLFLANNNYTIEELANFASFRRLDSKITIINYPLLFIRKFFSEREISILNDLYFEALTIYYFKNFWIDLDDQLVDSLAFGGAYYSPKMFQYLTIGRCTQVGIFSNIEKYPKNGWVIPLTHGGMALQFDSQKKIPDLNNDLGEYYQVIENKQSDFLHSIEFLVHFLGNGIKLLFDEKVEEAFINFWLALDSIFNKENKSNLMKNRVAALTWKKSNVDHDTQYNLMKRLYDNRNAFVHNGVKIDREFCLTLNEVTQAVLEILLKLHNRSIEEEEELTRDKWISWIDESYEVYYKAKKHDTDLLRKIGIL